VGDSSNTVFLTGTYRIKRVKAKTKARIFENMQEGDIIAFSLTLKNTTGSRGNYATDIVVRNLTRGEVVHKTQSELVNILGRAFELEIIH
jgi:hypothetical protein